MALKFTYGAKRPYYSGKHKQHGMNVQLPADPVGRPVWVSPALPGAVHDVTATRTVGLTDALTRAGVKTFADKGYQGAGGTIRTPFKRHRHRPWPSRGQRDVNRAHARIRAIGERAVATLKSWKALSKLRCRPHRATAPVQAILVLRLVEERRGSG
ncbi:transposase family protein [Streptosporangium sp. OZ121]|uniref:transposase family protein n=1 Tax=Streptosporangium sp. OZ121 TaxID=3444183 RepID=UPI003F7B066E